MGVAARCANLGRRICNVPALVTICRLVLKDTAQPDPGELYIIPRIFVPRFDLTSSGNRTPTARSNSGFTLFNPRR